MPDRRSTGDGSPQCSAAATAARPVRSTGPAGAATNGCSAGAIDRFEDVDARVEPAGRIEPLLDPAVHRPHVGVDVWGRRRVDVVDDADADLDDEVASHLAHP